MMTGITAFILRRLIQAIPTFFGITILAFTIMVLAPGDPIAILTFDPNTKPEERERLAELYGVNDPLPVQYMRWLVGDNWRQFDTDGDGEPDTRGESRGILRGDFGESFISQRSPISLIVERLPATIELNIAVLVVSIPLGVVIGVVAARMRGTWFDQSSRVLAVVGDAVPGFWLAFLLILLLGRYLDLLPMGGRCAPTRGGCPPIFQRLEYIILPVAVSALGGISGWSRFMRASMLETINSDYIRTAQAKGVASTRVWFHHAMRNAIIPLATFLGPVFVSLLGGAVIIETIFAWPGVGRLLLQSVTSQDYPVIMASVVIGSMLTILGYLISDVLYAVFDPRIRL
ncbi:MAG: ABC transporter permease [Chloroflexota bacterium]